MARHRMEASEPDAREVIILRGTPANGDVSVEQEATTILAPVAPTTSSSSRLAKKEWAVRIHKYFASSGHRHVVLILLLVHTTMLMLYGQGRDVRNDDKQKFFLTEDELDFVCATFLGVWIVEILARIFCAGPRAFWSLNDDFFRQQANRFDVGVMTLTMMIVVVSIVFKVSGWAVANTHGGPTIWFVKWGTIDGYNDWARLALAVPLLRIFSTIHRIRDTTMGLLTVLPAYGHIVTLLLCVVYFYAVVGCFFFASEMKYNQNYKTPMANFNSMLDAILTLFQLFVGAGWNGVLYAAMQTGKEIQALVFFLSFSVFITLLFTNLIIGVIVSGFESVNDARKQNQRIAQVRELIAKRKRRNRATNSGDWDEDEEEEEYVGKKVSVSAITAALKEGETPEQQLTFSYSGKSCYIDLL